MMHCGSQSSVVGTVPPSSGSVRGSVGGLRSGGDIGTFEVVSMSREWAFLFCLREAACGKSPAHLQGGFSQLLPCEAKSVRLWAWCLCGKRHPGWRCDGRGRITRGSGGEGLVNMAESELDSCLGGAVWHSVFRPFVCLYMCVCSCVCVCEVVSMSRE